ncbi:MAG: hypothetical protein KJT03_17270, partial [Verrucomicrobiae bacterium]|nr:hypothetical protein [Verrucomicrobiae bacterium]
MPRTAIQNYQNFAFDLLPQFHVHPAASCRIGLMIHFAHIPVVLRFAISWVAVFATVHLHSATEIVDAVSAKEAPYIYLGRTFTGDFSTGPHGEATATAIGPGVILTAAHVLWTNSPNTIKLPWENYRRWHPGVSSETEPSYTNVISIVSLTGYADAIEQYDTNEYDGRSPPEVFNRDGMVLIFSNDGATPYGFARAHPRAYQSGFLQEKQYLQVAGYPSGKYYQGDYRAWKVHRTTDRGRLWLAEESGAQFQPGYSWSNRLFSGGLVLNTEAGNSGGPLLARTQEGEPWLISGVVVGSNSLFRVMDQEFSDLIDTALVGQVENNQSRFRFTEQDIQVSEGTESPAIMVERIGDLANPASVSITYADIKTTEEVDYLAPAMLTWEAGEGGAKPLGLEILEDDLREGDDTVVMILEPDAGSVLDAPHTAQMTIVDNDLNEPLDEWEILGAFGDEPLWRVVFGEGKFVGAGGRQVSWWSPDFVESGRSEFDDFSYLDSLNYLNGKFIAAGIDPRILVSENGMDWQVVDLPTSYSVVDVAFGNGTYVAVGGWLSYYYASEDRGIVWTSSDAYNWTQAYNQNHVPFTGVAFGGGRFLAWAWEELYTSTDGRNWTPVENLEGLSFVQDIAWGGDRFVAVSLEGGIFTSSDGLEWTPANAVDGNPLNSITYRNGWFVAAGRNGRIVTSDDGGQTWK